MKAHYVKELLELAGEVSEEHVHNLLKKVIKESVNSQVKNIAQGGYRRMLRVLHGQIV